MIPYRPGGLGLLAIFATHGYRWPDLFQAVIEHIHPTNSLAYSNFVAS